MVCDEPVSALDVSIQAQIIDLLIQLRERLGLTHLFIAHLVAVGGDLGPCCGDVPGRVAEIAAADQVFAFPKHPYTKALISAIPIPDPEEESAERIILRGEVPRSHRRADVIFIRDVQSRLELCRQCVAQSFETSVTVIGFHVIM